MVGNPIMHHLVLGFDPTELGQAPFTPVTDEALRVPARELDLDINPGARVYVLPLIAGHVGADTAGVILSEAPHDQAEVNLIVDVGTNAEIVLGNRDRLLAASSPTGPAFEGAQISCGQRAAPGAIERVRIDRETFEPRFRLIGTDALVRRAGLRRRVGHRRVRIGDHRAGRGALPRGRADERRRDRRCARGADAAGRPGRPHLLLRGARPARRTASRAHAERRAAGPAGEGGALRRLPAAHGRVRDRQRRPDPARRGVRRAHRPDLRDGARPRARLRAVAGHERGQRRGDGSADRAAEPCGSRGDRGRRPPRGEAGDGGGAALPGALRRRPWASPTRPIRSPGWPPRSSCPSSAPRPPPGDADAERGAPHERDARGPGRAAAPEAAPGDRPRGSPRRSTRSRSSPARSSPSRSCRRKGSS